jgi:hypothetical protein
MCSGRNSPRHPERAPDPRVRLAQSIHSIVKQLGVVFYDSLLMYQIRARQSRVEPVTSIPKTTTGPKARSTLQLHDCLPLQRFPSFVRPGAPHPALIAAIHAHVSRILGIDRPHPRGEASRKGPLMYTGRYDTARVICLPARALSGRASDALSLLLAHTPAMRPVGIEPTT